MKKAKRWLQQLLGRPFQPISRSQVLEIAAQALAKPPDAGDLFCHEEKPANCRIYGNQPEPCWYVYAPWDDENEVRVLRSRRVILIGKWTGDIHYDGPAGDEG